MTTENQISLAAIVLAGGQSRRMGRDKALISINGVPLLRQVCEVALACTPAVYVVTARGPTYQSILPGGCKVIPEPQASEPAGPLVGFVYGLAQIKADWVLLLACDLPRLQPEILAYWATLLPNEPPSPGEPLAWLPRSPKGWNPLCGFYHQGCLSSLQQFIQQGGRSFQTWLAQISIEELWCPEDMVFNCNTPDDLATLGLATTPLASDSQST